MKRLSSVLIATLILGNIVPHALAAVNSFVDIEQSFAKDVITEFQQKGFVTGIDGTHFDPESSVTRAQFVTILVRSLGIPVTATTSSFSDVNDWSISYVEAAYNAGLVHGVGNGLFNPTGVVTREQAAVMLVNALTYKKSIDMNKTSSFADFSDVSDWAKPFIATAQHYGLVKGDGVNFYPKQGTTREEAVTMIKNLLQILGQTIQDYKITPENVTINVGDSKKFKVEGANSVTWSVSANGTIDQNGLFTATSAGKPTITALINGVTTITAVVTINAVSIPGGGGGSLPPVDKEKPVITLKGDPTVHVDYGTTYTDQGVTITDNKDTNLSAVITYTKDDNVVVSIDTQKPGIYIVHYNAKDAAGNNANEVTRTVIIGVPNVTADDNNNTIIGIDTTMEYSIDGGDYVKYDATNPPNLSGDHIVLVRVAATGNVPASEPKTLYFTEWLKNPTVTIYSFNVDQQMGNYEPNSVFQANVNFADSITITNFQAAEYSLYNGDTLLATNHAKNRAFLFSYDAFGSLFMKGKAEDGVINDPDWTIGAYPSNLSPTKAVFKLTDKQGNVHVAEAPLTTVPKPDAPNVTADDVKNMIVGLDNTMEFSVDDQPYYTHFMLDNPPYLEGDHTVKVRAAATYTTPAGKETILTFTTNPPVPPTIPNVTADDVNNVILGIDSTLEYSIDGGDYVKYDTTNAPNLTGDHIVLVRVAANGLVPESQAKTLYFTEWLNNPTLTIYAPNVDQKWQTYEPNTVFQVNVNLANSITSSNFQSAEISLYNGDNLLATNQAKKQLLDSKSPGLTDLFGKGDKNDADSDPNWIIGEYASNLSPTKAVFKFIDTQGNVHMAAALLTGVAKPEAPNLTADDLKNAIVGLDTTMEFSVDDQPYLKFNGNNAPDLTGKHTVKVRVAAAGTTPTGEETILTFTTNPPDTEKPVISLNGESIVNVPNGANYTDAGVSITDNSNEYLLPIITYTKDGNAVERVETNVPGTYVIHYNVTDKAGNKADEVIRTVIVQNQLSVEVTANPTTIVANGSDQSTITVQFKDAQGNDADTGELELVQWATGSFRPDHSDNGRYIMKYAATMPGKKEITLSGIFTSGKKFSETVTIMAIPVAPSPQ